MRFGVGIALLHGLLSGIGIAMFHPPAGRDARRAAGGSATAMSYFAAGGSVGFFLGPALVTPALDNLGLAVSAGGLFMPLLGLVAEHCGPQGVIFVLALMQVIAILASAALREPARDSEAGQDDPRRLRRYISDLLDIGLAPAKATQRTAMEVP
jgi:MFS family permease